MSKYYESPAHLRIAYHMLRNSGFVPEEVRLSKEMEVIREKLKHCESEEEKTELMKELSYTSQKFNFCVEYNRKFKKI